MSRVLFAFFFFRAEGIPSTVGHGQMSLLAYDGSA